MSGLIEKCRAELQFSTDEKVNEPLEGQPVVFLVQEAYNDRNFFKAAVTTISRLIEISGCSLICVDGCEGDSPPYITIVGSTQQEALNIASYFEREGLMTAKEYMDLLGSRTIERWGVENLETTASLRRDREALGEKKTFWQAVFARLTTDFHNSAPTRLSPRMAMFWEDYFRERNGNHAARIIARYCEELKVPLSDLPSLTRFFSALKTQASDATVLAEEHRAFVLFSWRLLTSLPELFLHSVETCGVQVHRRPDWLMRQLTNPDPLDVYLVNTRSGDSPMGRIIDWWSRTKQTPPPVHGEEGPWLREAQKALLLEWQNRVQPAARDSELWSKPTGQGSQPLGDYIVDLALLLGYPLSKMEHSLSALHGNRRLSVTTIFGFLAELMVARKRLCDIIGLSACDLEVFIIEEALTCLSRLVSLECSPHDWVRLNTDEMQPFLVHDNLCAALGKYIPGCDSFCELTQLSDEFRCAVELAAQGFYANLARLGNSLATNTIKHMRDRGQRTAILLAGAFHVEAVKAYFTAQGVLCVPILPHFIPAEISRA